MANTQRIRVWNPPGLQQVEWHRGWGVNRPIPKHWHDEFHMVLGEAGRGDLFYRGSWHPTPAGSLFLVAPGEVHYNRTTSDEGYSYRTLNLHPELLRKAASQAAGRESGLPAFRQVVYHQPDLLALFGRLHQGLEDAATLLEQESLLLAALVRLIQRCAERLPRTAVFRRERRAVRRVHDFLAAHFVENTSLAQLAGIAGLSPYHLNRVFAAEMGLPPHAFQTQLRVLRARTLLQHGRSPADVAADTGFADQSHLTRVFKRVLGLTPGAYQSAR